MTDTPQPLIPGLVPEGSATFTFSARSLKSMKGIDPDLRRVCDLALKLTPLDFVVIEGLRTEARQQALVNKGKSQTMNSKHLTGHAIDFVDTDFTWDLKKLTIIADAFKEAAKELNVKIVWGGNWGTFVDMDHIELSDK